MVLTDSDKILLRLEYESKSEGEIVDSLANIIITYLKEYYENSKMVLGKQRASTRVSVFAEYDKPKMFEATFWFILKNVEQPYRMWYVEYTRYYGESFKLCTTNNTEVKNEIVGTQVDIFSQTVIFLFEEGFI